MGGWHENAFRVFSPGNLIPEGMIVVSFVQPDTCQAFTGESSPPAAIGH